jgi:nicotinate-nucleotide adenylyltransferase
LIARGPASPSFVGLPPVVDGQRIGLFGGSFNPAHAGHRAASLIALRRLRLDWVWWLVSPGNPLKDTRGLPRVAQRLEAARRLAAHPRIVVTGFEQTLGSPYTCDTVAVLRARHPAVRFVLLMGADSFADLHRWKHWRSIVAAVPIGVVDRPGSTLRIAQSHAAAILVGRRLPETSAATLPLAPPPAYVILHDKRSPLSSTAIRDGHSRQDPPSQTVHE